MASIRTIAARTVIAGTCVLAAMSSATARTAPPMQTAAASVAAIDQGFKRCPQTPDEYADAMKSLSGAAARARTLADENPLLEPDAAFLAAELAATKTCVPTVATLQH